VIVQVANLVVALHWQSDWRAEGVRCPEIQVACTCYPFTRHSPVNRMGALLCGSFFLYFFCCQDNWVGFCSWLMAHGSGLRTQGRWLLTRPPLDLIRPIENAFRSRLDSQFKFNAQGNGNESKTNTHANCALSRGYSLWGPNLGHFEPGIGHELWKKSIGKRPKGPLQGLSVQIKIELVRIFNFQLPFVRLSLHLKGNLPF